MTPTTVVRCVYGARHRVATADLTDPRKNRLSIYTKGGVRWTDTPAGERAARNGKATMLHRGNIDRRTVPRTVSFAPYQKTATDLENDAYCRQHGLL